MASFLQAVRRTAQGTCLLSYSFSLACPESKRESFLQKAREAFAIGLLTKAKGKLVTSQQELHTFLKAAYSITITDKWLHAPEEVVEKAAQACQQSLGIFYKYCKASTQEKDVLSVEIMHQITRVKHLLGVDHFPNSDKGSFIPDTYRNLKGPSVNFTQEGFSKILEGFQKYHASLCETTKSCKRTKDGVAAKLCLTALETTAGSVNTECHTELAEQKPRGSGSSNVSLSQNANLSPTLESTGSSWYKLSNNSSHQTSSSLERSGSGQGGSISDQSNVPRESDDDCFLHSDENTKQKPQSRGISARPDLQCIVPKPLSHSPQSQAVYCEIKTEVLDTDGKTDFVAENKGSLPSLSQLVLKTASSSLGESFGSQSSWEKISTGQCSPMCEKNKPNPLLKSRSQSAGSDGSFFIIDSVEAGSFTDQGNMASHPVKTGIPSQSVSDQNATTEQSSYEMLKLHENGNEANEVKCAKKAPENVNVLCYSCLYHSTAPVPDDQFKLSKQDYQALLAGICHQCLLKRLCSNTVLFKLEKVHTAHNALHLKFSKATGLWTAKETCVYIGDLMNKEGKQRRAIEIQFLHQEERLSSYVGKDYLKPREVQYHLKDVERQMTAQYYVTEFNKSLYDKDVLAQIFFIPSDALLILNRNEIVSCITVEPYMLGDFIKLTNNTGKKKLDAEATKYGLAFGHFTYLFSGGQEVVVDLQGWTTSNGKGLTYLTDPQIHSTRSPQGPSNFAERGLGFFLKEQHGPTCNEVCNLLKLPPLIKPHV